MKKEHGLSLIELMIALTLGIIVLLAVSTIFANTSRSRGEMEKSNRQTENGRYASQLLANNLRMAGYLAEFDPTPLTPPAALPDICATDPVALRDALPLHVQGINDAAAAPGCLADVKNGTDIMVIRRASSCVAGSAGCTAFEAGAPHLQTSQCAAVPGQELSFPVTNNAEYALYYYTLSTAAADFTKRRSDCATPADIFRYRVDIYFIANNNEAGDGIPTLKRAELAGGGFTIVPLVDGIENMQVEYGLDGGNTGIPEKYTVAPATVDEWRSVMAAQVHLLVRNTETTLNHKDNRTYTLGAAADGTAKTVGPFGDGYKRHVYAATTRFANPSWRRQ